LTEGLFVTQVPGNAGISLGLFVWVTIYFYFMIVVQRVLNRLLGRQVRSWVFG